MSLLVMKPAMYVVINQGLGMSAGKVAAQVGHAVMGLTANTTNSTWLRAPHRWLIVLEAQDEAHLWSIERYLNDRDVTSYLVIDEGVNEIPALSATALAVGPLDKDSLEASYLSGLKKYKSPSVVQSVLDLDEPLYERSTWARFKTWAHSWKAC